MLRKALLIRTLLTNSIVTAIFGTALAGVLFYGQPRLVFRIDIAGVPVVLYGFISTAIPVIILTTVAHVMFGLVSRRRREPSAWIWLVLGISLGALAGGLAGVALLRATGLVLAGVLT